MSDLLRSAFNYISQVAPTNVLTGSKTDHPLIGNTIEVGGLRLKIRSLIAEGGFALVFAAQDSQGSWFALKRQLAADQEATDAVIQEIRFLRELTGNPAIIRYVQAAQLSPQESGHGKAEFLLVTELCSGGSVVEVLQKKHFTPSQVMKIFFAACTAVRHMHARTPPITHRDIKVENLLFDSYGFVKLCDFGSATKEVFEPNDDWSAMQRTQLEEELARHTTPMYRAPEILDLYSNSPIGPAQDIWALGCILFYLCYRKHPFEDSAKLRIINAKYVLPEQETAYTMFHPLIQRCLQIDPRNRPSANELCESANALAVAMGVDLTKPVEGIDIPQLTSNASLNATSGQLQKELFSGSSSSSATTAAVPFANAGPPPRPPPPAGSSRAAVDHTHEPSTQQQASAMFGALKGQGMSWLKNIKDKTTAVAQTVQSTYGNRGPDITFVTSHLVIAPLSDAIPEALAAQAEEVMRIGITEQSKGLFAIYNLSHRHLRCNYNNRLSEVAMPLVTSGLAPTLNGIIDICKNMSLFLKQQQTNFIVITGPEVQCVLMACALLIYTRLAESPMLAVQLVAEKRPAPIPQLPTSYHRQLDLLTTVVTTPREALLSMVHNRRVILESILISPCPTFNRLRNGCRPVVEVYSAGQKLWSSAKEYELLQIYEQSECSVIDLTLGNVAVSGDVQIVVYHARWIKMQNRMQQLFMFSLSFHANFIDTNSHLIEMKRNDLDILPDDRSRFDELLRVGLRVLVEDTDRCFNMSDLPPFLSYDPRSVRKMILVSSQDEYEQIHRHLKVFKKDYKNRALSPSSSQQHSSSNQPDFAADRIFDHSPSEYRDSDPISGKVLGDEHRQQTASPQTMDSFFSSLQWNDDRSQSDQEARLCPPAAQPQPNQALSGSPQLHRSSQSQQDHFQTTHLAEAAPQHNSDDLFSLGQTQRNDIAKSTPSVSPTSARKIDEAEAYERLYGIRVSGGGGGNASDQMISAEEEEDSEKYKFDCEKKCAQQPKIVTNDGENGSSDQLISQIDLLLNLGNDKPERSQQQSVDPFADFYKTSERAPIEETSSPTFAHKSSSSATCGEVVNKHDDLLDWTFGTVNKQPNLSSLSTASCLNSAAGGMQRNISAPSFATNNITSTPQKMSNFDPFADFLASSSNENLSKSTARLDGAPGDSAANSGRATPSSQRPNYSRAHFDAISSIGGLKPKLTENTFDDLLSSQGFSSSSKNTKTMIEMKKAEDNKTMDPVSIKIRDWTTGKEGNIRALLGSLNDVLWDGADKWNQPNMSDLLTAVQVKKFYRKACLVIHPDKQVGTENELLARAIFTELNDAWTAFENAGSPSL